MSPETQQAYLEEIRRLNEENRRLAVAEATHRAEQQRASNRMKEIKRMLRETREGLEQLAARY